MRRHVVGRLSYLALAALFVMASITSLWLYSTAKATSFGTQTGYYVGTGVTKTISGLGFQPGLVLIKSSTAAGVAVFKSSAMAANATAFLSATADNTATSVSLTSDGFTLGALANVNTANVLYTWTAFSGSDCSANGNFCVGTYTGNAASTRTITTGFQPSMVMIKRSTAVAAHFRTASMAANRTEFFTSTAADTTGTYIRSFAATSFDIGATDNVNAGVYYYVAFKSSGTFAEGTYTGNGSDNRSISGIGMQPDLVLVKNSTSATTNNRRAVMSGDYHFGDSASYTGDAVADVTNMIQAMEPTGFQVGSGANTNESSSTMYWFAFGGASAQPAGSGSFMMAQGSYTGTGAALSVTGLGFAPDLVMVKDNAANFAVFRISQMAGDTTAYLANASADFAGGITSLNSDGFSIGTSAVVNTASNVYQWQAFGNAYKSDTNSGAADFTVGTFYGNGIDNRNLNMMPFQPDFVAMKRNSTTAGIFRSSAQSGDLSGFFASTAETADVVQSLTATGFQVGTNAASNSSGSLYRWFAFKIGTNFDTGTYTGNGIADRSVSTGFTPDAIWIKRSTAATAAVQRPSTLAGDATQGFLATANAAGQIKTITTGGFTLGTDNAVNSNNGTYRYAAWRVPPNGSLGINIVDAGGTPVGSPYATMSAVNSAFACSQSIGTLGTSSQKIRVTNMSGNANWVMAIAPTDGATAVWKNSDNTQQFDFNDTTNSGCTDGVDSDTVAGKLRIEPSGATLTPQTGCSSTGISLGNDQDFNQGVTDSVTLLTASSTSNLECYWDLTNVGLRQTIPTEKPADAYTINFMITTTAY